MNNRGRNNDYTVEMWIRVNSSSENMRKIFGPIVGEDGLYVDGPFLSFKIGDSYGSHFIGEWFRPMLIHIRLLNNSAIVLLNGEEVMNITFDSDTVALPLEYGFAYGNQDLKNQDWLGFWAYSDIPLVELDTFSIYSYAMPTEVAKRRWVWGQAVTSPEQTNSSINSVTAYNDYSFANYASNYNYPDFANWKQAFYSNLVAGDKSLTLPEYSLPIFEIGTKTTSNLFNSIAELPLEIADPRRYITLSPNQEWEDSQTDFLYFENLGVLNDPVETIYGIFKTYGGDQNKTLVKMVNKYSGDFFSIVLKQSNELYVEYSITSSGVKTIIATKTVYQDKKFTVGLNLKKISLIDAPGINRFFSDQSAVSIYIAGDGVSKFNGNIYKFGFEAAYNNRKISNLYDSDGIFYSSIRSSISNVIASNGSITYTTTIPHLYSVGDTVTISGVVSTATGVFNLQNQIITKITDSTFTISNVATGTYTSGGIVDDQSNHMFDHTANYTLKVVDKYDLLFPDIAVAGYWEDYMPLSYFSKAIVDYDGNTNYELDSIQFNQDFPEPPANDESSITSVWTYGDLQIEYSIPTILTYADLNNAFYTKWENYLEMSQNSIKTSFFDTTTSQLRSFISFQYIADGANNNLVNFENYAKPLTSGIIDPDASILDWRNTAYEVTTGTLIYPPKTTTRQTSGVTSRVPLDFNDVAIVYHLDFKSEGILHQRIRFKELQLASHVLERTDFTPVGSRFGVPVYYYSKSGVYYDLKAKNPISTYKKSTPYLYLNRQSGWKLRGEFNTTTDRGLAIPVNLSRAEKQEVSSIQMWVRFADRDFPEDPIMIFSVEHNGGTYDFYIQADSSLQRGSIFGVDRDSLEIIDTIGYYVNGQSVFKPFISKDEWAVLGLEFLELLDFSNRSGRISLNGPLTYNNVSYNLATNIEKDETLETRVWTEIYDTERAAAILSVTRNGNEVTYKTDKLWVAKQIPKRELIDVEGKPTWVLVDPPEFEEVGDVVNITGASPAAYNLSNARVVSVDEVNMTFTVISPTVISQAYVSGGQVTSSSWRSIQDSLEVINDDLPPYTWNTVKVISQSRVFSIDPKAIYEKYTGSNRIIVDDESSGILVRPERFKVYSEISWSETTKLAV
jgi:hypothetical protein